MKLAWSFRLIRDFFDLNPQNTTTRFRPLDFISLWEAEQGATDGCQNWNCFSSRVDVLGINKRQLELVVWRFNLESYGWIHRDNRWWHVSWFYHSSSRQFRLQLCYSREPSVWQWTHEIIYSVRIYRRDDYFRSALHVCLPLWCYEISEGVIEYGV